MIQGEEQTQDIDQLVQPVGLELAGAGLFFIFLHDLGALFGIDRRGVSRCDGGFFQISHGIDTPLLE